MAVIALDDLHFLGQGLKRPECVLAHHSGLLLTSDWSGQGGVAQTDPDGTVRRIEARDPLRQMRPNGIALEPGGSILMADLGAEEGGVFRLFVDGAVEPVLQAVDGHPLPPTNFVHLDEAGRTWITVSTRLRPRDLAYRPDAGDGFVVLLDRAGARIVVDGLGYTNECCVSPDGAYLYVNETFARRVSRFPILDENNLGDREIVARFGAGTYPDGLVFDSEGAIWITSIVSNRVIRVFADGRQEVILEDADIEHLAWTEAAFVAGELGRPHLDKNAGRRLRNISSLAFGGPDLKTVYLGCLLGNSIASFMSPVAGWKPPHWQLPLADLGR